MNLKDIIHLLGKKVKVIDVDGEQRIGYFMDYTNALNNPEGGWSIEIYPSKSSVSAWGYFKSDIKSIEKVK